MRDFEALWSSVRRHTAPGQETAVVTCLDRLWRSVEEYAHRAQIAYLHEAEIMARERSASLATHIGQLFGPERCRDLAADHVAEALGLHQDNVFEVVVACGASALELAEAVTVADTGQPPLAVHKDSDSTTLFWCPCAARLPTAVRDLLEELPTGSATAAGLAEVPNRAHSAHLIAKSLLNGHRGSVTMRRAWPFVARHALAEAGFADTVLD